MRQRRQITTVLFLDVDGTISIHNPKAPSERFDIWSGGLPVWPLPMVDALLQLIDEHPHIHPVWMTSWYDRAHRWNERAGTRLWPDAYGLSYRQRHYAHRLLGYPPTLRVDSKLVAVHYFMRHHPEKQVIWIEDGFANEVWAWAHYRGNVHLIDTTTPKVLSLLRYHYADLRVAAMRFLDFCRSWETLVS